MNKPLFHQYPATTRAVRGVVQPSTIRVLHVINGEHYSGAERVQDLLGQNLPEFGFSAGFACVKPDRFPAERQSRDCPLFEIPMRGKFDRRVTRPLCEIITSGDYEILHAHTPRTLMVASRACRFLGRPLVYHVHSPVGRDSTRSFPNRLNQWMESWSARRVNHLVCVSESIRAYMAGLGHPAHRLTTVPNGVPVVDNVGERSTPTDEWTIGTTALFRPRKGTEVLLHGLAALRNRGVNVRLLAVGPFESAKYEQTIKSLAEHLGVAGRIEWTGFTRDVPAQLRRMDIFVLPSLFGEGLPMVVLEAMAGGVPVVAARVEGIPEAIRDGVDGLVFEPGDANDLAARIELLVSGQADWNSIRHSALERQRCRFSDTSMAEGVATVYEKVLDEWTRG